MPRKPEPSFSLKQIIWDIAASIGTDNFSAIYRGVDEKLRQLHKEEELYEDETPDTRTLHRIIEIDINRLPSEVVVAKLPRHVWQLRNDYEAIERLAVSLKAKQEAATEALIEQKPYEETPHKQKIRELAGKLINEISLPWIFDSFIIELKPGLSWHKDIPPIRITKKGQAEVELSIEGRGEIDHLYQGLHSHLESGGFEDVLTKVHDWRIVAANNLMKCHQFITLVKKEVEDYYKASIPVEYKDQPGCTVYFLTLICGDAVEQAREKAYIEDAWYKYEGLDLRCGAFLIYKDVPDGDLNVYKNAHISLRAKYAAHEQAKKIAKERGRLYQNQSEIRQQLHKFIDMEHLPGQCELCSHPSL